MKRWTTSNKAVFNIGYHLIWCPKYRRKVLINDVEKRFKEIVLAKAKENGFTIENMEVMPDHVHLFVKTDPTTPPHRVVQQLKGASSFYLRKEFPHLKSRMPCLWSRSYFCESVGHISEDTVKRYIDEQKTKDSREKADKK